MLLFNVSALLLHLVNAVRGGRCPGVVAVRPRRRRRFADLDHLARRQDVKLDKFDTYGVLAS